MFTGLVEATSKVISINKLSEAVVEITVEKPDFFNDLKKGHSVAHNGVCLTIKNKEPNQNKHLKYDLGPETLSVTKFKDIKVGEVLNLERPLKIGDRLHGHLVTGHVDEVGEIESLKELEGSLLVKIYKLTRPELIWKKGSIVIDGVSLTINEISKGGLEVCLIPETLEKTNLSQLKEGQKVNIEYDFWAKGVMEAHKKYQFTKES